MGKIRSKLDAVIGIERRDMTPEEYKVWETRVGMFVGFIASVGALGGLTYVAVKVINLAMGVG